jgi:uncharacterized protein YndB with AHSA1/START domain
MTVQTAPTETREAITLDEFFPHPPDVVWRALTDGALLARWIMAPAGFAAVVGQVFTFQTKPGGAWDGVIRCEVLRVEPGRQLSYAWNSGHPSNEGYGAPLESVVTFTLRPAQGGCRLRLDHEGFVLPRNQTAYDSINGGWGKVLGQLGGVLDDIDPATAGGATP